MKTIARWLCQSVTVIPILFALGLSCRYAAALPAFALREKVSCVVCHTNGSAPHLTKTGYLYRRAGYRFANDIGDAERDQKALTLTEHAAVGTTFDYHYMRNAPPGTSSFSQVANNFDVRELEVWPLVGAFLGNLGAFTEIDASPQLATGGSGTSGGSVALTHAELTYVIGSSDMFMNLRGGLIAPQGFGASDQWLDDGALPFFDLFSAQFNQDTLTTPLGANNVPEVGVELGLNYDDSHLTLGLYNGYDGTSGLATKTQSSVSAMGFNQVAAGTKDFKIQLDQFLGENLAATVTYYNGHIPLLDPSNTLVWIDPYTTWRIYLTYGVLPGVVDLMAGVSYQTSEYVNSGSTTVGGHFYNSGAYLGGNYYVMPHLTVSGHFDFYEYNNSRSNYQKANGFSLMVGVPFEYSLLNFHYVNTLSDVTGLTNDFRIEWRLIF